MYDLHAIVVMRRILQTQFHVRTFLHCTDTILLNTFFKYFKTLHVYMEILLSSCRVKFVQNIVCTVSVYLKTFATRGHFTAWWPPPRLTSQHVPLLDLGMFAHWQSPLHQRYPHTTDWEKSYSSIRTNCSLKGMSCF